MAAGRRPIQMGDMVDGRTRNQTQFHGGHDVDVLRFLTNLRSRHANGGDVRCLFGNHELMNLASSRMSGRGTWMEAEMFGLRGEADLIYGLCELVIIMTTFLLRTPGWIRRV
jgi:hypothetical protein